MATSNLSLPIVIRGLTSTCTSPLRQRALVAPFLYPLQHQTRPASNKSQKKGKTVEKKKTTRGPREFRQKDLKFVDQFALCDAMRYIRAFEVGHDPAKAKYEIHIRLKTKRDGPVIRNMVRFPHAVQTESRICVICPPGSKHEKDAKAAGATLVGEEDIFEQIKQGIIEFDRCICHTDSYEKLTKAGLGRVLGPRGLMPSAKTGTVVDDVVNQVQMLRGGTIYRERDAVIRMPIGQLGFSPEQLRDNLRATIDRIKKDANLLSDRITKEIYEVVLSSTNGPGFSLNGDFKSETSPDPQALQGL